MAFSVSRLWSKLVLWFIQKLDLLKIFCCNLYYIWYQWKGNFNAVNVMSISEANIERQWRYALLRNPLKIRNFLSVTFWWRHQILQKLADSCEMYRYICLPSFKSLDWIFALLGEFQLVFLVLIIFHFVQHFWAIWSMNRYIFLYIAGKDIVWTT